MTPRDFLSWEIYFAMEPRGSLRADYRSAQIKHILIELQRDSKQHPTPTTIEECLLRWEEKRKQTWQEQKEIMLAWAGVPPDKIKKKR
jgi:hypothetical protein